MFATRRLATAFPYASEYVARFHTTRPLFVEVGDAVPDLEVLAENSPGNKVNLAKELKTGKGVIIGAPGAFSAYNTYTFSLLTSHPYMYYFVLCYFSLSGLPPPL
jgi:hypothetical protein